MQSLATTTARAPTDSATQMATLLHRIARHQPWRPALRCRSFHLFRGPDELRLTDGTLLERARTGVKSLVDRTITADGLWHLNRLAILASCNPYIGWEGLRICLTATSFNSFVYFGLSSEHLKPRKMLWSALFFVLQGVALSHVIADLVPDATLDADERAFYERNLAPFGLPSRVFRKLRDAADAETAAPGTVLLKEGALNYRLFFVLSGRVGIWRVDAAGRPHQIGVVDAESDRGAIFGDVGYVFGERKDPTHYGEFALADFGKDKVTPSRLTIMVEPEEAGGGGGARVLSWDKRAFRALLRDLDSKHHNAETIVQGAFAVAAMEKMRETQVETETTLHAHRREISQLSLSEKREGAAAQRSLLKRSKSMLHGAYRTVFGGASR